MFDPFAGVAKSALVLSPIESWTTARHTTTIDSPSASSFCGVLQFIDKVISANEAPRCRKSNLRPGLTALRPEYETLGIQTTEIAGDWPMDVRRRALAALVLLLAALPAAGRAKDKVSYGEGLIVSVPLPASEVEQVVQEVAQNGIIRGTKEYNKDEFVAGAKAAASSHVFPAWTEGGKVFYKVREHALDPRNFKDGGDVGTLVVRYVVKPQGEKSAVLRINALFAEDFRRVVHQSNGSVESGEYKDIREHVEALELMKKENVEAERERQEQPGKKQNLPARADEFDGGAFPTATQRPVSQPAAPLPSTTSSSAKAVDSGVSPASQPVTTELPAPSAASPEAAGQTLEKQVEDLRKQLERQVKPPGAPLKSAPFHTASTLQSLTSGTEVLILISTPYWYGVETHEGQHGWIMRDQLEQP
jgi:hypothetical protein